MKKDKFRRIYICWILVFSTIVIGGCREDNNEAASSIQGNPLLLSGSIQMMGMDETSKFNGGESVGLWVSSNQNTPLSQADIAKNIKFYQSAAGLVSEPRTYVMENESTRETFNTAVKNAGGTEVNLYPDDWSDVFYFSSTCSMLGNVTSIQFSSYYESYGMVAYTPKGSKGQSYAAKVRAFYHF